MATFTELVTASTTPALVEKIKIATLIAADGVRIESSGAPNHQDRVRWAAKVFNDPETEAGKMIWPVLVQNRAVSLAALLAASDAAVQAAVDAALAVVIAGG